MQIFLTAFGVALVFFGTALSINQTTSQSDGPSKFSLLKIVEFESRGPGLTVLFVGALFVLVGAFYPQFQRALGGSANFPQESTFVATRDSSGTEGTTALHNPSLKGGNTNSASGIVNGQDGEEKVGHGKVVTAPPAEGRTSSSATPNETLAAAANAARANPPVAALIELSKKLSDGAIVNDPVTQLMWTANDNGKNITWDGAEEYCRTLHLGGYSDWRVPTIDELQKLDELQKPYDPIKHEARSPFHLTSTMVWSSTKERSDAAWYFVLGNGGRAAFPIGMGYPFRALCVRRSGG